MRTLISITLIAAGVNISAQTFKWSAQQQLPAQGGGKCVVYDNDQNVIVGGEYNNFSKENVSGSFLTRYKKDGSQLWKILMDHKLYMTISFDHLNNKILASIADFNTASGGYYINRYDLAGNEIQSIPLLPMVNKTMANKIHAIVADHSGGYVIIGTYSKNFKLGQFTFPDPPPQEGRLFIARFDGQDNCLWVVTSSSGSAFSAIHACVDQNNDILIAGRPVGLLTVGAYTTPSPGKSESFVCKVSRDGQIQWLIGLGSNKSDVRQINAICADYNNNVYVTGELTQDIVLPCGSINGSASYYTDIFLLKLNSTGQCLWLNKLGGPNNDIPCGLSLDPVYGGAIIAGDFEGQCNIGNFVLASAQSSTTSGVPEAFIARYDAAGNAKWALALGVDSCGRAWGGALAASDVGDVYFTGQFICKVDFGGHLQSNPGTVAFVTSLSTEDLTSLRNNELNPLVQFFPNPSSGIIKAHIIKPDKIVSITVFNTKGEKIIESEWLPGKKNDLLFDLSSVPAGLYLIHCTDGESTMTYKQIIN